MQKLSNVLAAATAAIEPGYFRLSIHGGDPVYRERVYSHTPMQEWMRFASV